MEEALISVFLEPVVSNLVSEVIEQTTKLRDRAKGVFAYKDDINKLSGYLKKLRRVLNDEMPAYRRFDDSPYDQNPEYKKLVKAMYQIAEDAEDVIQDCEHEEILWHALFLCQCERVLWQRLLLPFTVSTRVKAIKSRIEGPESESIQSIRDRMKVIAHKNVAETKNATSSSILVTSQPRTAEPRRTSLRLTSMRKNSMPRLQAVEDNPVGLDERIREVKDLILDKETYILGIHGMGGSGKSMLMKCAWNREEILKSFVNDLLIWVSLTSGYNLSWLRQSICQQMRINFNEAWGEKEAQNHIYRQLDSKRYLMVVDGVWHNEGEGFLSDLGVPPFDKGSGSKIVVISRDRDDLSRISPNMHFIHMESLSEKDSWELFERYAFGSSKSPLHPEVSEAARKIVEKCHGHPLALKAYGAAMAGKGERRQWVLASKDQGTRFSSHCGDAESRILECLGSSYASLAPPLRLAFLYLAAFPENLLVRTTDLIDLWNAERLIRAQTKSELDALGLELMDLMINRCLVEGIEVGSLGRVRKCKMHPMLRRLALHILAREDDDEQRSLFKAGENITEFPFQNVGQARRISLMYNRISCLPKEFECQGLRTLILRHSEGLNEIPSGFLKRLTWLRTLDLSMTGIQSLPTALGDLKRLEYLNLSRTELKTLPDQVNRLYRLKKLNLFECKQLECLPFEMDKLENLHYLNLRRCDRLKFLPHSVTQIASLQCLIMDGCNSLEWQDEDGDGDFKQNSQQFSSVHYSRLEDLKSLTNLRYLSFVCATTRIPDDVMCQFKSLERLEICRAQLVCFPEDMKQMVSLQDLRLSTLERLVQLPSWISNLHSLKRITLEYLKVKALPSGIFETLPWLCLLEIENCDQITELPSAFGKEDAFPSLEELKLDSLNVLKELPALEKGSMSLLKELRIRSCPAIIQFPEGAENLQKNTRIDMVGSTELIKSVGPGGVDRERMTHLLPTMTW